MKRLSQLFLKFFNLWQSFEKSTYVSHATYDLIIFCAINTSFSNDKIFKTSYNGGRTLFFFGD